MYQTSKQFQELSLDQKDRDYKSIADVTLKIIVKEKGKFKIKGDLYGSKCKIKAL